MFGFRNGLILILLLIVPSAFAETVTVRTSGGSLNFRNSSGGKIGSIPNGTVVEIDKSRRSTGKWLYVKYNGRKGRIFRSYTRAGGSVSDNADAAREIAPKRESRRAAEREKAEPAFNLAGARGPCGTVSVDCRSHRISFSGTSVPAKEAVIDCGEPGKTKNGSGRIGGHHSGQVVKDGVRIEGFPGMGDSGGGKVLHYPWWKPGRRPTADNRSNGCIHISPAVQDLLRTCQGSRLIITGAAPGGPPRPKKKRDRQRQQQRGDAESSR